MQVFQGWEEGTNPFLLGFVSINKILYFSTSVFKRENSFNILKLHISNFSSDKARGEILGACY